MPATNPKIDELRGRLKADPKSRLFFPLAEELRKVEQLDEAEQVLRSGLSNHPTYLSAWVSLGRVLHELGKHRDAVDSLTRALHIDPGNVVAARLLGDTYLALGEKVEAIKKYKLVRALLPADEDLDAVIEQLDRELQPVSVGEAPVSEAATAESGGAEILPFAPAPQSEVPPVPEPAVPLEPLSETSPFGKTPQFDESSSPWAEGESVFAAEQQEAAATGDAEPMRAAHMESPFEEPAADAGYSAEAMEIEKPAAMHIAPLPVAAEMPVPLGELPPLSMPGELPPLSVPEPPPDVADVFAPVRSEIEGVSAEQPPNAPGGVETGRIGKLERWLAKVKRE